MARQGSCALGDCDLLPRLRADVFSIAGGLCLYWPLFKHASAQWPRGKETRIATHPKSKPVGPMLSP